jgi:hypothetical protein
MNVIQFKNVRTENNFLVGTVWPFRNCQVEMHAEGFTCSCKKKTIYKCNHLKSVELGLLGVSSKEYQL